MMKKLLKTPVGWAVRYMHHGMETHTKYFKSKSKALKALKEVV
jgi:hypothetical protein